MSVRALVFKFTQEHKPFLSEFCNRLTIDLKDATPLTITNDIGNNLFFFESRAHAKQKTFG